MQVGKGFRHRWPVVHRQLLESISGSALRLRPLVYICLEIRPLVSLRNSDYVVTMRGWMSHGRLGADVLRALPFQLTTDEDSMTANPR